MLSPQIWLDREHMYLDGAMALDEEYFDTRVNVELPGDLLEQDHYPPLPWTKTPRTHSCAGARRVCVRSMPARGVTAKPLEKAVVLAAGRGTRMRAQRGDLALETAQAAAAEQGLKSLIPFHGHAFIAYVLSALADAGFRDVCIVTGPGASPVREAIVALRPARIRVTTVVQPEPLGSANALLAAEAFAADDDFAVINGDNFYPPTALRLLHTLPGPGLVAFAAETLTRGNVPAERIAGYALVTIRDGTVNGIIEKPDSATVRSLAGASLVSMTCWRFGAPVFAACRAVPVSLRGEHELPDAVRALIAAGEPLHVVVADEPVLDLSVRADIPSVALHLQGARVRL